MIKKLDSLLLIVNDTHKTAEFYRKIGFEIIKEEDGLTLAKLQDFELHFHDKRELEIKNEIDVEPRGGGAYIYINVENIDNYHQSLINQGLKPSSDPKNWSWGESRVRNSRS